MASVQSMTGYGKAELVVENGKIIVELRTVNGKTAEKYYNKYLKQRGRCAICLPSTSPANAAWTLDRLIKAWEVIKID